MCESLPFYRHRVHFVHHKQILLAPFYLWAFSYTNASSIGLSYTVYRKHVSIMYPYPWKPALTSKSMGTLHCIVIQHHNQYSFVGRIFNIIFAWALYTCIMSLFQLKRGLDNLSTLQYTTIGFNTTCYRDNTMGELQMSG